MPSGSANARCDASSFRGVAGPEIVPDWEAAARLSGCVKRPAIASLAPRQEAAAPQLDD